MAVRVVEAVVVEGGGVLLLEGLGKHTISADFIRFEAP